MPIRQGCSVLIAKANYGRLILDGYTHHQAYAICLKIAKDNIGKCDIDRREAIRHGELFRKVPR